MSMGGTKAAKERRQKLARAPRKYFGKLDEQGPAGQGKRKAVAKRRLKRVVTGR